MAHFTVFRKSGTWRIQQGMGGLNAFGESLAISTRHRTKRLALDKLGRTMELHAKHFKESSTYDVYTANGNYDYGGIFAMDEAYERCGLTLGGKV
tara:strand:- start:44 stop:328 length:285 start_codon:yes stop_codon:yes gene_type:complete